MLIVGASAPGVTGVAETTRLIDLAIATEGLVVVGADFATRIDLLVANLHANAFGRTLVRVLETDETPIIILRYFPFRKFVVEN